MNVPYNYSSAKRMSPVDQGYPDAGDKAKSYPMQMFAPSSNTPQTAANYNCNTQLPPLSALGVRGMNGQLAHMGPSPLAMQYHQGHQAHQNPQNQLHYQQGHAQSTQHPDDLAHGALQNQPQVSAQGMPLQNIQAQPKHHLQPHQLHAQQYAHLQGHQFQNTALQNHAYHAYDPGHKSGPPTNGFEYHDASHGNIRMGNIHPQIAGKAQHMNPENQFANAYLQPSKHVEHVHQPHQPLRQHSPQDQMRYPDASGRELVPEQKLGDQNGDSHQEKKVRVIKRESPVMLPSGDLTAEQALTITSKLVPAMNEAGLKKKRGRPKKMILDPSTNLYIDSLHANFKKLNKILKRNMEATAKTDHGFLEHGGRLDTMNDQALQRLIDSKDRRGRPRKFPIEETGITVRGVRVSGTMKRRTATPLPAGEEAKVKRKRGRPKRDVESTA